MEYNVELIGKALSALSTIDKGPLTTKEGTLDIDKLNKTKEVKALVKELKGLGVKSSYELGMLGFTVASMVIRI